LAVLFVTLAVHISYTEGIQPDEITVNLFYSFLSYCDWTEIDNLLPSFVKVSSFADDDVTENFALILVSEEKKQIIVSIRGTVESAASNLAEDADILPRVAAWLGNPKVPSNVLIHPGFFRAWKVIRTGIFNGIASARNQYNFNDIIFTGHSLGGALATIAALDYWVATGMVTKVVTFGSPRVGNYYFARFFEKIFTVNSFRFVNHNDFIPHMPFEDMGYYHTSVEHWFQNGTSIYRACDFLGEDMSCSDKLPYWQWDINDHMVYPDLFCLNSFLKICNGTNMDKFSQSLMSLENHRQADRTISYGIGEQRPL